MRENIIKTKSFAFAVSIVKLYQYLCSNKKECVLSKQLLRSGTSVGPMVREAEHAETKVDFKHKICIHKRRSTKPYIGLNYLRQQLT
jgi:four helix bundle protein